MSRRTAAEGALPGAGGAGGSGAAPATAERAPRVTIRPAGHWWPRLGSYSLLLPRRVTLVTGLLVACCTVLGVAALGLGATHHGVDEVLAALTGEGSRATRLVILEWRAPRIVLALAVGAALGLAGAIFQSITRNPLGSPDLIGFTVGAQTGILVGVLFLGSSFISVSLASLVGGIAVGAVIFALAFRGGFGGLRLILAGIAVSSMLGAFNRWMILNADIDSAYGALRATTGTLSAADWSVAGSSTLGIAALTILLLVLAPRLRALELGEELAASLGSRTKRDQALLVILGTMLVALATVAAGPIAFVALVAPHLARMVTRAPVAPLGASGAMGALLLLSADVASQTLLESMPVGIVTAAAGGLYFMALLLLQAKTRRGA
ncbi:MAG: iron chelate uptake ABC transporter family permease subunit [Arthrobacter sp.]|jgi:iron complex transport system permease protein|nr:iron chelate uptake ABC transporter family permease subunit [Arthrobacter sp.]